MEGLEGVAVGECEGDEGVEADSETVKVINAKERERNRDSDEPYDKRFFGGVAPNLSPKPGDT